MKHFLFIYFYFTLSAAVTAQQLSGHDEQFLDSVMNANYRTDEPGAVLLIAKKGQPVFRKGYGLANLEFNVENKPEYIFRIASMSKQITAVCVLQLAQEGKLSLQDDIKKYLPDYNTHGRHITIENLLNHTSGINDFAEKKEYPQLVNLTLSHEEMMNSFMNDSLVFEPGTNFGYSNSGYFLAGLIVEKVSGLSLSEYRQQNIFDPLEMNHTSIGTYDSLVPNAVYGYNQGANGKYKPIEYMGWGWFFAVGDILTNLDDLLKWDNALYTEKLLKKEWLEKAWKPFVLPNGQSTNYGLGWCSSNFQGIQLIEHSGGMNGFACDGIRIPSQQLYIAILSNKPSWQAPLVSAIVKRLVGQNETKVVNKRIDLKTLEDYVGVYAINNSLFAKHLSSDEQLYQYFTLSGDTLFAQSPGYQKGQLLNVAKDLFVPTWWDDTFYQFNRNENGNVVSVELYNDPLPYGPRAVQIKTDLQLPKEKVAIMLSADKLALLAGKYDFGGSLILPINIEGNQFYFQLPGQEKEEFFAETETNFFSKKTDVTLEFTLNNKVVSKIKVKNQGTTYEGKKIE